MAKISPKERYLIIIDSSIRTADNLFSRITDTAYLGYSSFSGWDAFADMFMGRLETSDILIEIRNEDLSGLGARDREIYSELLAELVLRFPQRLRVL